MPTAPGSRRSDVATLWLVGMMGSGKTTVAPVVASLLDLPCHDTDDLVAIRAGRPAADLVAADEPRFRAMEAAVVASLAGADAVVACGGGVVLDGGTVALMRESGVVVLLDAPREVLATRVAGGSGRPLLGDDPEEALARIARERDGRYRAAADAVVDGTGSPDEVARRVVEAWTSSR